jgi:hypothetical protein
MNSKRLIIAFFAVSLAALCVSCFAVISVARTYQAMLEKNTRSPETYESPVLSRVPDVTEVIEMPDQTSPEEDITVSLTEEVTTEEITTEPITTDTVALPSVFTLLFDGDRLVVLSPKGERVYERITDIARMHPKDLEVLLEGISFDTREDAMSAVYDVIS